MISIIIPVYKVEQYLDRCIQSVVNQSYRELEIILVDDGSPDNCPRICDEWKKRDPRIRVIHKANGGLSDARNAGMRIATGEFLGFVDSDDWIAPFMYEKLLAAMNNDQSDIAACTVQMIWENNSQKKYLTVCENLILNHIEAQRVLLKETKLKHPIWYKLYKRAAINGIQFEKGKYHEDVFWSYQVIGNAEKISIIDYVGYYYYQRTQSIMGESYSLKRLDAIEAYCNRYEYLANNIPALEPEARQSIMTACIYNGQMSLKYLPPEQSKKAFNYLNDVKQKYPLGFKALRTVKRRRRLWLILGSISLKLVCRIKNCLNIGV